MTYIIEPEVKMEENYCFGPANCVGNCDNDVNRCVGLFSCRYF
jgi:hypothetical protein